MSDRTDNRRFRVYRYKRGDGAERFDEFDVPVGPHSSVLDALRWIQLHLDPSLAMRHSCLHASCGTCGMQVDGREELACVCWVQDQGTQITVEPLANLPILTDLVVEMTGFFERFPHAHPIIRSSEPPVSEDSDAEATAHHAEVALQTDLTLHHHPLHHLHRAAPPAVDFVRLEDCIECGLCLSACPVASTSHEYVGPAALAAAERLLEEPRGVKREDVLAWASRPEGVWRCHVGFECTQACPADAIPAERIMALRRQLMFGENDDKEKER
ncbi:MAG TPA: 2Fe-2S iron-sulfur cluster-binding protein [Solirubrobacteraceae bacterium]|nr:2Fe-2S iron-sulfur cluster-binding protein [Solirubrobacteraceae bacterium]